MELDTYYDDETKLYELTSELSGVLNNTQTFSTRFHTEHASKLIALQKMLTNITLVTDMIADLERQIKIDIGNETITRDEQAESITCTPF